MTHIAPWNRDPASPDVTDGDLHIARLDGFELPQDEVERLVADVVALGQCAPDEQSKRNWIWDVLVREDWENRRR